MLEIIVPLNNNGHFVTLHVILPYQDKHNGGVFVYNYLVKGEDKINLTAKMWWAEFFGIFYQKQILLKDNVCMGIKDISLDDFNQRNHSEKTLFKS